MVLEIFYVLNGYYVFLSVIILRFIVCVFVVLYLFWVEVEMLQDILESIILCMKRGYMCWKKIDIGVVQFCCFGFFIDLLRFFECQFGFVFEIYFVLDGQYGIIDEEMGKWNGVMNELVLGRGDLVLDLVMIEIWLKEILYLILYFFFVLNILVKKDGLFKNGEYCL